MKNSQLLFLVFIILTLVSCQSKEEKAAKLIKEEMYKTLYDFSSYEPIETTIDSAFTSIYRDSTILVYAYLMNEALEKVNEYLDNTKDAQSSLEIWAGSYSGYGLSQYNKAKEKFTSNLDKAQEYINELRNLQKLTKEKAENFESTFCGWQAKHKFRCKTKGGSFDLPNYLYLFDTDLKEITYHENMDDEDLKKFRELIDEALKDNSENE
ncbi:MAG: hypothetical protein Q8T08_12720 [Ignavibacteria bacterium]|nr:hypothetical protein [Ignavibacteria bacterium]